MKRKTMMITLAVALIGLTAALSAQPPMPDGPHGKRGRGGPWDKMSANIENLRMMKMLEAVNPDEKQSEKFVPLVYAFRRDMKEIIEERNAQVDKIKESLKNDAGDNEIKAELDELRENKTKLDGRIDKFLGDCEEILRDGYRFNGQSDWQKIKYKERTKHEEDPHIHSHSGADCRVDDCRYGPARRRNER
jgi:Spy/CpxP family protein refolding chaperone